MSSFSLLYNVPVLKAEERFTRRWIVYKLMWEVAHHLSEGTVSERLLQIAGSTMSHDLSGNKDRTLDEVRDPCNSNGDRCPHWRQLSPMLGALQRLVGGRAHISRDERFVPV